MPSTDGTVMIRVENLDPLLRKRNGEFMHITGEYNEAVRKARLGEAKGKWRVVSGIDGVPYESREMVAGGSGDYLVKESFGKEDLPGTKDRE